VGNLPSVVVIPGAGNEKNRKENID